jgi:hypothetical protein
MRQVTKARGNKKGFSQTVGPSSCHSKTRSLLEAVLLASPDNEFKVKVEFATEWDGGPTRMQVCPIQLSVFLVPGSELSGTEGKIRSGFVPRRQTAKCCP